MFAAAALKENAVGMFSAHQMGTCRMGHSPATSALDCNGETWEVDGLFVADASTFPTASGSNPMVTTLAIAQMLAWRLAVHWTKPDDAAECARRERRCTAATDERQRRRWRLMMVPFLEAYLEHAVA